jgi:hypothetical protein
MAVVHRFTLIAVLVAFTVGLLIGRHFTGRTPPLAGPYAVAEVLNHEGLNLRVIGTGEPGSAAGVYLTTTNKPAGEICSLVHSRKEGWEGTVYVIRRSPNWTPGQLPPGLARRVVGDLLIEGDPALSDRIRKALR